MVRHGKPGIMLDRIFSEHKLRRSMVKVPWLTAAATAQSAAQSVLKVPLHLYRGDNQLTVR